MSTSAKILGFSLQLDDFGRAGEQIITPASQRKLSKSLLRLADISGIGMPESIDPIVGAEVVRRFYAAKSRAELKETFSSKRMKRTLAFSLTLSVDSYPPIIESKNRGNALRVLHDANGSRVTFGVLTATLQYWSNVKIRPHLLRFLEKRVSKDSTGFAHRLLLKHKAFLLDKNGASNLATALLRTNTPLDEIGSLCEIPRQLWNSEYFQHVATIYSGQVRRSAKFTDLAPHILDYVELQRSKKLSLLCLTQVILGVGVSGKGALRKRTEKLALELLGDPKILQAWQSTDELVTEIAGEVEQARRIVLTWIASRLISLFFRRVSMDESRRRFWMKYAHAISDIRIFVDVYQRQQFSTDKELGEFAATRLGTMSGSSAALVMRIKDRVVVEIGKHGNALYVYDRSRLDLLDKMYASGSSLRTSDFPWLYRVSGNWIYNERETGRARHIDGWEGHVSTWMKDELGVSRK